DGQETKLQVWVERLTQKSTQWKEKNSIVPGTIITTARGQGGMAENTSTPADTGRAQTATTKTSPDSFFQAFFPVEHARDADLIFSTDQKPTVGGAWKVNLEEAHRFL